MFFLSDVQPTASKHWRQQTQVSNVSHMQHCCMCETLFIWVCCSSIVAVLIRKYERKCILTSFFHDDFCDAKCFRWCVYTLNDDVLILLSGWSAVDDNLCSWSHSNILRSAERVRGSVDCWTLDWQRTWKSDLKVVQTIYYSSANQMFLAMHVMIFWTKTFNFKLLRINSCMFILLPFACTVCIHTGCTVSPTLC